MKNKIQSWVGAACLRLVVTGMVFTTAWAQNPAPPDLPDSPGTVVAQAATTQQQSPAATPDSPPQPQTAEQPAAQPENTTQTDNTTQPAATPQQQVQKPVGTAAAEKPITTGVAASNPAGAAIAPARQKRFRSLVIKVAALAGAGVAIGTVAALSAGSPSRPPGSR